MLNIVVFTALLAAAAAAPGLYQGYSSHVVQPVYSVHEVHSPLVSVPSKTTVTKSSQLVNHGGHEIVHAVPVVHSVPVHSVPVYTTTAVHAPVHSVATSSQNFKLDSYGSVPVHTVAAVHSVPLVHSSPVYYQTGARTGDSAVSQQSSTVHKTEHSLVHSVPLYSLHH